MTPSKTPQDQIRDAFKEHLKSYEDCLDYSELLLEESKTNARKAAFLAGSYWMLEAVLRELRSKECPIMLVDSDIPITKMISCEVWADWIEKRFKD